ncbi:MAG: Malonyl CoA-acyl carrier protein transacylase [Holosporales bacterium]
MRALIFPGQGSQSVGMGKIFFDQFQTAKNVILKADDILGYSLSKIMFDGPIDVLTETNHAQVALVTVSMAMLQVLLEKEKKSIHEICSFVAGHSLGEYSALIAANVISFEVGLNLVKARGDLMKDACPNGFGAMVAVIGSDIETIKNCLPKDSSCVIANDNAPSQIVLSGTKDAVSKTVEALTNAGVKRCILLPVSAPFHSPYMQQAEDKLAVILDETTFNDACVPVVSNTVAVASTSANDIKNHLKKQMCHSVRWRESVLFLNNQGVKEVLEVGQGSVLTGLNKRIAPNIDAHAYTPDTFSSVFGQQE